MIYLVDPMFFFFQAEDGIRDGRVTGVQTCALPICPDRAPEGDEAADGRDPGGGDAGDPRAEQRDQDRAAERREQAEPGAAGHPRSSESVSTSSESCRRWSATTRPSPTHTSEAATAMTASAKIWP